MRGAKLEMSVRGAASAVGHGVQNLEPALTRLLERPAHDVHRDAANLDVHLKRGDAGLRAGHLEVHVTVVVFSASDVGQHRPLARVLVHHEAHRDACDRRLDRHACVHQRQRAAADRGHRRRSVRFEDVGDHPQRVGELGFVGDQGEQRALGQGAVTNLPPARSPQELHLADRERREVVVQHEALVGLTLDRFDLLRVVFGAERRAHERLRLTAGEDRGAVHARQHARLDPDRADFVELPAVEPLAAVEDLVAEDLFLEVLDDELGVGALLRLVFGDDTDQFGDDLIDRAVVFQLVLDAHRLGEPVVGTALDLGDESGVERLGRDGLLGFACGLLEVVDGRDELANRGMGGLERAHHLLFGRLTRAGLDHDDGVGAAGDDEIDQTRLALGVRRIDDVLTVDEPDANAGDAARERNRREAPGPPRRP